MKKFFITFLQISARVIIWIAVIALIYNCGLKSYEFGFRVFAEKPVTTGNGENYSVVVGKNDSDYDIAKMLKEKGLIRDAKVFALQCKISSYDKNISAGRYTLNTSMTAKEMIAILAGEKTNNEDSEDSEE